MRTRAVLQDIFDVNPVGLIPELGRSKNVRPNDGTLRFAFPNEGAPRMLDQNKPPTSSREDAPRIIGNILPIAEMLPERQRSKDKPIQLFPYAAHDQHSLHHASTPVKG